MVRKSGIVMATPRSMVDLVAVRLECLEAGVDFESLGGRCWPTPVHRKARFVRALPHGRSERSEEDQQEYARPMPNYLTRRRQNQSAARRLTDEELDRRPRLPSL